MEQRPKNYLVESILVTLFCCLPIGIVSIVFASQVNTKFDVGDITGANKASKDAKKWMIWGLISWFILIALYLILVLVIGGIGILSNS